MAMKIANNMSAINSLNIFGQNNSHLSKDMERLSTGLKLIHAGDDTSGYSIAKRMKVRLRSLEQCTANVNTGYNMIKTASEGVQQQLDILKTMRDITLKASDDTYSQKDRDVLAIETNQMLSQLDAIAEETTYNGMQLLNQRVGKVQYITQVSQSTKFEPFDPTLEEVANTTIGDVFSVGNGVTTSSTSHWGGVSGFVNSSNKRRMDLDFSNALAGHGIDDFNMQGLSVLCSGCDQFVSIVFATDRALGTGELQYSSNSSYTEPRQYIIGLKGAKNAVDIANAVYDGITTANRTANPPTTKLSNNNTNTEETIGRHDLQIKRSGGKVYFEYQQSPPTPVFYNGIKGASSTEEVTSTTTAAAGFNPWKDMYIQSGVKAYDNTAIRLWNTSLEALFPGEDSLFLLEPDEYPPFYDDSSVPDPDEYPERYEGYVGTNEEKKAQLWRDEVWHLTRAGAQSKGDVVRTREGAESFLKNIDQAIKYTLHVSTDFGAQMMRMEINAANLTISQENLLASKSTITDADMAKEMVNFARDNLLMSASQSMLAQANHESENVLGLLA